MPPTIDRDRLSMAIKLKLSICKKSVDDVVDELSIGRATLYRILNRQPSSDESFVRILLWLELPLSEFIVWETTE